MSDWPPHPVVHEIFTWVWLADLSVRLDRPVTLADVPQEVWDRVARPGIDAVWLMGVWRRSAQGAAIARSHPAMSAANREALPDLVDADVVGSAYCVQDYTVDPHLGGDTGLAVAREALARRGTRLILDLVPNHVAPDHRWVTEHPEYFVQGSPEDLAAEPDAFIEAGGRVLACGRDPYFPAWPEVVQLDASHGGLRSAMVDLVLGIAERCDGVRCDMAMLVLDDVFWRTWGERASGGSIPGDGRGYWPTVVDGVRAVHPGFAFWAEAYWDLEPTLLSQGFDACYDKRLYDRLVHGDPAELRARLGTDPGGQRHTIRFAENHDEPRAATVFSPAAHRAALVTVLTVPGVALLHEGEAEGRRVRVPVTLGRRPTEALDADLRAFVDRLVAAVGEGLRRGEWAPVPVEGWPDNRSAERLLAWTWTAEAGRHLVVVNLSGDPADGRVRLPWTDLDGPVTFADRLSDDDFERDGSEVVGDGLYVALDGFGVHLLRLVA